MDHLSPQSGSAPRRVNEIDLLRFLAAFSVVFFHYTFRGYAADHMSTMPYPSLARVSKYGYLGVDLFFIISGFVILMTARAGSLRTFVISRVVRLYPAFWASCTLTSIVTLAIGAPRYSVNVRQYVINMTMLNGFIGVPSVDGAYWSLFIELKFYALVAILLMLRRIDHSEFCLILWLAASVVLEFLPHALLRTILSVDYSAYFIFGATCFLVWSQGMTKTRGAVIILSWVVALYEASGRLSEFETHYRTEMSSLFVGSIITAFFAVMLLISLRHTSNFGRRRWVLFGALTYPLYLLHQHIGFMVFNIAYPAVNPHVLLAAVVVVMLGAAFMIHVHVEKRFSLPMKNALNYLADLFERSTTRWGETAKALLFPK